MKSALRLFYDFNKWAMNVYWLLGLKMLYDGTFNWYGLFMMAVSFTYFLSAIRWYAPKKRLPRW